MPLSLPLSAPTECPNLSALTNVKDAMSNAVSGADEEVATLTEDAIKRALGLSTSDAQALDYATCSFDPLGRVWRGLNDERGSGSGDDSGATTEAQLLRSFMQVQVQIMTVTSHIATVVGFSSDEAYVTAANAVVAEAAKQIHAANVQDSRRRLLDQLEEDSPDPDIVAIFTAMVEAAANDTQASSRSSQPYKPKPKPKPDPKRKSLSISTALTRSRSTSLRPWSLPFLTRPLGPSSSPQTRRRRSTTVTRHRR